MATSQIPAHIAGADEDMQRSLELWGLLHSLLRYLWLIALVGLICGVGSWLYVRRLPNQYRSTAVIEIQSRDPKAISGKDDDDLKNPEAIETIIQNFHNRSLMERTARALNLATDSAFLGQTPKEPVSSEVLTNMLLAGSSASRRPNTRLVDVTFVHSNPLVARQVTNALVAQFIEQGREEQRKTLEDQEAILAAKYQETEASVKKAELKLQEYKENLGIGSMQSVSLQERHNYVEEKLRELNTNLTAATSERRELEADAALVERAGHEPKQLLAISSIAQDPQVSAAQTQVNKAQADFAAVSERYGAKHPVFIAQSAQLANVRASLEQAARSAPERLQSRYKGALAKEQGFQKAVSEQQKTLLDLEKNLIPFRALERDTESARTLAQAVLQRYKESTLARGQDPANHNENQTSNLQVVEPAVAAVSLANRRRLIMVGAAMAGALLVAGAVAALHLMNTSIRTVDSAERLIGVPVFAAVPTMPKGQAPGEMLALLHAPNTPAAESYRTLRCALSLLGPKNENRVFLFTSAVPGEGKSLTAANTAIAFAQQGFRTLLVEADLRRPSIATKLFGMPGKLPGIGEYMTGQPAPVTPTPISKLSLMTAGSHTPNPAELLSSAEFDELVRWMRENYERIVIDTAPINVVSDTLNIVSCASVICLVVRSESTSRKVVLRAVELLRRSGVKPDGMVLNCMPLWKGIDNHYDYGGKSMYGNEETYGNAYAAQLEGAQNAESSSAKT